MVSWLHIESSVAFAVIWQSTLALVLAMAGAFVWRRHPARAHFCLTMGLAAALTLPIATQTARHFDWGVLPASNVVSVPAIQAWQPAEGIALTARDADAPVRQPQAIPWIGGTWFGISAFLFLRMLLGFGAGVRLLATARPLVSEHLYALLESAMAPLGVHHLPAAYTTDAVRSPAIWCWAIHPAVLLPSRMAADPAQWTDEQWRGIFTHELAHLRRRDHLAAIFAELACVILWWQPLAWWCRARIHTLSDAVCDRWAVNGGEPAEDYAATLIALIPQRRTLQALSIVSDRQTLKARIERILDESAPTPMAGRRWTMAVVMASCALIVFGACMQPGTTAQANGDAISTDQLEMAHQSVELVNADMEAGDGKPAGWEQGAPVAGVEYLWDRSVAHGGTKSLSLSKIAQRYFPIAEWSLPVSLPASDKEQTYRLSVWVKADKAYKATIDLQWQDRDGSFGHTWAAYIGAKESNDPPATHDWQQYTGSTTVPPGAKVVAIGLQIYGPGTVWFDDVSLSLEEGP